MRRIAAKLIDYKWNLERFSAPGWKSESMLPESATRKEIIDLRLNEAGWNVADRTQVIEEFFVPPCNEEGSAASPFAPETPNTSGTRGLSDYVLLGKNGKALAVVEAKQASKDAELGREQAKQYCHNIQARHNGELPFCFYTNGHEIFYWNLGEAPPQRVHGFPTRQDLERLLYIRKHKRPLGARIISPLSPLFSSFSTLVS